MAKGIRDVLEEFREHSLDERAKGALFEQLMKDFLKTDTQYERLFDEVWLWSEYPERRNRADTGIDLVARERDTGELVAIQCKFYAPQTLISKPDIDSFLASSSKAEFQGRIFISTSDNWGKNAEEAIAGQKPEVARIGLSDLDNSSIDWDQFSFQTPDNLEKKPLKSPRPHQEEAIKAVLQGFQAAERGKLIMACGTGKTFTSLKLVERMFPQGGTVLFLVPSISLLSQALKEWTIECQIPLRSYAVCSDVSVGKRKNDEDLPVTDLAFPATTNTQRLVQKFTEAGPNDKGLTVIFSTYQSSDVVAQAQSAGIPEFDLIICDEAHRTTGVTLSDSDESAFVKVHNQDFIRGSKRLYMTATPKVFSDASAKKAEEAGAVLADMGKPDLFGEEFHRLGFGEAVERGILTDYKVLVLAVDESHVAKRFQRQFADEDNSLKLEDAAKIVGCWNGLSKRSVEQEEFQIDPGAMKRAVAFSRSIAESKKIAEMFQSVVDEETSQLAGDEAEYLRCEVEHVDGSFNSLARNEKLDWLKQDIPDNTARILSNARCLTEGVDVPALDAVMFLNPRDSQVDVVQAVGRVMRKLEGKKYGYVILPIGVPADMDPATALNDHSKYKVVWQVLQALRSHDERFDAMVNKIDLTKKAPQIGIIGVGGGSDRDGQDDYGSFTLDFPNFDQWRDAILAKIVQKVGEKRYWENWAKDIGKIAETHLVRIQALVASNSSELRPTFLHFLNGLRDNLNPGISERDAMEMLAQHLITKPIFDALFEEYDFSSKNVVSVVMEEMLAKLEEYSFEAERESLQKFYESVRARITGIQDLDGRQQVIKQLYEQFFKNAFTATSEKLGIVYTPNELVDFVLSSAENVLRREFNKGLGDQNVHILDPFTGTGTFIVRLLQSGLIKPEQLSHKYGNELHANEIVLLAYYIAAINIEETFHALSGEDYKPFEGIVLTDSFQIHEQEDQLDGAGVFAANNERVERQKALPIQVVIGNPPWAMLGSKGEGDTGLYEHGDERIRETYVASSSNSLKLSLFDSYIRAIRLASDIVKDRGVIAFVTNGGFLDSSAADGVRKSLLAEFSSVYVVNLRGNSRGGGQVAKEEGENVFPVRVGVAILLLVKDGSGKPAEHVSYVDIGASLDRRSKLEKLVEAENIFGFRPVLIEPDNFGDWINKRSTENKNFLALDSKSAADSSLFLTSSSGFQTHRDWWVMDHSHEAVTQKVKNQFEYFNGLIASDAHPTESIEPKVDQSQIKWSDKLQRLFSKGLPLDPADIPDKVWSVLDRPFAPMSMFLDKNWLWSTYQLPRFFPSPQAQNKVICVSGVGASSFSTLVVDRPYSYDLLGKTVGYGRYVYETPNVEGTQLQLDMGENKALSNIDPRTLETFSDRLSTEVDDDDVFWFVYGILHSRQFVAEFASNLKKERARIPWVDDFWTFREAGERLASLHLGLSKPRSYVSAGPIEIGVFSEGIKIQHRVDKSSNSSSVHLNGIEIVNGIPSEIREWRVGGKLPLDWFAERMSARRDKTTGISLSAASLFSGEGGIEALTQRIRDLINTSLETSEIIAGLPALKITN